jgi:hypothetical protein
MFEYHVLGNITSLMLRALTNLKRFWTASKENDFYGTLLSAVADGVYGTSLISAYNPFLNEIRGQAMKLSKISLQMLQQGLCSPWICEALREAVGQLIPRPRHIIICDGFALHDALFLAYKFEDKAKLFFAINPGGKTKTYEYLIKYCPGLESIRESTYEKVTLNLVGELLSKAIHASYEKFDDFDKLIHSKECIPNLQELKAALYRTINKLISKIVNCIYAGNSVLLLADHGYDMDIENCILFHEWTPQKGSLSILAPFMVIKQ